MQPIVIIGSGLAGYTVAREFRKLNTTAPVTLICADHGDFYSKPMLSNAFQSNKTPTQLVTTAASAMVQQLNITLMADTVVDKIDVHGHRVYTTQGSISYSKLVIATGASPVRADIGGDAAEEIISINHLQDYARFYQSLTTSSRIAIIGGGLIGCEFANDLVKGGHRVVVIHPHHYPLHTLLPHSAGERLQTALASLGVDWRLRTTVKSVAKAQNGFQVELANGDRLEADIVLSAIGLRPQVQVAAHSEIVTRRGIVVDALLQASVPDVYALGDCAEYGERWLPYVLPIMAAARALAKTLNGEPTKVQFPYMPVVVKTPVLPLVVQLPPSDAMGEWHEEQDALGLKLSFIDKRGQWLGFVLAGDRTKERAASLGKLPPIPTEN